MYRFDQEDPETLRIGQVDGDLAQHRGSPSFSADSARAARSCRPGIRRATRTASTRSSRTRTRPSAATAPDGLPTFDDGLRAAVLVDAVIRSYETGNWVEVPS